MSLTVRFHAFGGPEVLAFEQLAVGEPGPGEVRLRMQAIGLNRAEAAYRTGRYVEKAVLPSRLGYEGVGVIEALGPGVSGWQTGQSVCIIPTFSMNAHGVYAQHTIVPAHALALRPPGLDTLSAASVWMAAFTAYGALVDIANLQPGEAVLITAASSSVGLAAIQIARRLGAVPIAVTRTADKREALLSAGAAHVIVSDEQAVDQAALQATDQKGVRLVFDPVAGPGVAMLAATLAHQGILVVYGNLSGQGAQTPFPHALAVGKGLCLRGYLVFEVLKDPQRRARAEAFILDALADGALQPRIDRCFDFSDIVAAHRHLEANGQVGKVVVHVAD
jgi:NADPH:quinone reductase-like Zn-dependent oxidoreductase